ncbi:MAG: hypothetical protein ABSC38_06740 [Verrucomicrobiia bacterium]
MQNKINRSIMTTILAVGVAALATACASTKCEKGQKGETEAQRVSLADLPGPVRATVDKVTSDGKVKMIDKEMEKGKVVYDVEAMVSGKHMEFLIAADGTVLGTETSIEYNELPDAVRAAAEKYFGSATGLEATKGVEEGVTSYEIEGRKNGKKVTAEFDPSGKLGGQE